VKIRTRYGMPHGRHGLTKWIRHGAPEIHETAMLAVFVAGILCMRRATR
jgi:hypothetical protein